jgi:hypothetical protein
MALASSNLVLSQAIADNVTINLAPLIYRVFVSA